MFKVKEYKEANDDDGKVIWTTEKVNKVLQAMEEGYEIAQHPFYEGDPNYKKGNIVFEYTDLEWEELKKCKNDIVYFANKHCTVMTDDGYQKIKLRPYQAKVLQSYQNNRWNIFLAPRQIGKTITSAIFLTWYLLFHFDKNVLLMSNKGATTKEIMDKIKAVVEGLPFFLKPGCMKKDVMTMIFDNKCRIIGQNTTKTGGIGFTIHLLFLDEFAHIQEGIKKPFYENVYPTLSSSKISRVIITSTPNGYDLFHDLYDAAVKGANEYTALRVDWWEVPGRDEAWKAREIANLGSEEAFNQQYGCQFLSASSLLLSADDLLRMEEQAIDFEFREIDPLDDIGLDYSGLKWHPEFDPDEIDSESNFFVISVDLAEGVGRDYTVFNMFKIDVIDEGYMEQIKSPGGIYDFFGLTQIGVFRSNVLDLDDAAKILYALCVNYFNQENLKLIIEYNTYGSNMIKNLITLYPSTNDFEEECIVRYHHRVGAKTMKPGLRLNKDNKKLYCEKFRANVSNRRVTLTDKRAIMEATLFSRNPNGTYSAQSGNDDIIMSSINATSLFDTLDFYDTVEEYFDTLPTALQNKIERIAEEDAGESDLYDLF